MTPMTSNQNDVGSRGNDHLDRPDAAGSGARSTAGGGGGATERATGSPAGLGQIFG
jgi:hypothetical protein